MTVERDNNMETCILNAAEKLFMEKGFSQTSTTEIAREAGCNQALVHYYFRTKENLFQKIFEGKIRLFASELLLADSGGTFEERLQQRIEAHFDVLVRNPRLPFLIVSEVMTNPDRVRAIKESVGALPLGVIARVDEELQEEIRQGRIRPMTILDLVLNVVSLNIFLFLSMPLFQCLLDLSDEQRDELIAHRRQEIVTMVLRSIRP